MASIMEDPSLASEPLQSLMPFSNSTPEAAKSWLSMLPSAADRVPFSPSVFYAEFSGVWIGIYVVSILAQLPNTHVLRLGIMSLTVSLAYHIGTSCDVGASTGGDEPYTSFIVCVTLAVVSLKTLEFATTRSPYRRLQFSARREGSEAFSDHPAGFLLDAGDLVTNLRGIGWDFATKVPVPPMSATSRSKLLVDSLMTILQNVVISDFVLFAAQAITLQPSNRITIAPYGSIMDRTLPPSLRYAKALGMTVLFFLQASMTMEALYATGTLLGVGLFQQEPAQWPPLLQDPWLATSVADFWGRRWQQMFRRVFVVYGAKPFGRLFGRPAGVLGAFFVSGVMHESGMWSAGGVEPAFLTLGLVMVGVGCLVEAAWERASGRTVGGVVGWCWTMVWLLTWGIPITDTFARRGFFESALNLGDYRPSLLWIKVVDRWADLH